MNLSLAASFDRAYKGTQSQNVVPEYGVRLPISGETTSGSSHLSKLCTRTVSPESKRDEISPCQKEKRCLITGGISLCQIITTFIEVPFFFFFFFYNGLLYQLN